MPTDPSAAGDPVSIWTLKPWWCQPWSILSTGIVVLVVSLLWPGRWWVTLLLGLLIGTWWWLFLVLVPSAWVRDQILGGADLSREARDQGQAHPEDGLP